MYDSWGSSWGATSAWGSSWVHTAPVVVIDTHDDVERINEYKRRKEELHASILRAFEEVTGETKVPTVQEIKTVEKRKPLELRSLERITEQVNEYEEIDKHILMLSKMLQDREMDDIAYIASIL